MSVEKLDWTPAGRGAEMLKRPDGSHYKTAVGRWGTYEWVVDKAGRWAAYFFPSGVQTSTPVVLVAPGAGSEGQTYTACVRHNQGPRHSDAELQPGGREPMSTPHAKASRDSRQARAKRDAPPKLCAVHHTQLPATGICDDCA